MDEPGFSWVAGPMSSGGTGTQQPACATKTDCKNFALQKRNLTDLNLHLWERKRYGGMLVLTSFLVQVFAFTLQSQWTERPTQPPGSGRTQLESGLKCNENWCKPFAEGYAVTEAVPSPRRSMMRYPTCSLVRCVRSGTDLRAANKLICIRLNCQTCPPSPCPFSFPGSVTHIKPNKDKCTTEFIQVIENQDGAAYFSPMLSQEIKINSPTSYFNIAYHNHR